MEGHQVHGKPGYSSVHDHYASKMMRISMSVGVVWAMASICLSILVVVVFLQDQWIGDTPQSEGPANFGLWRWCSDEREGDGFEMCRGALQDFPSILSPAFRAATVFTGLSVVVTVCAIIVWLAICFTSTKELFKFSGVLQLLSGVFMLIVILSYPAGWDNSHVVTVCGEEADDFSLGTCEVRWSYMLAVITCCDAFLLGTLALTLSCKQIRLDKTEQNNFLINNMEISSEIKHHHHQMLSQERLNRDSSAFNQNNFLL